MKFKTIIPVLILGIGFASACSNADVVQTDHAKSDVPVAGEGYDTVAYFAADSATKGSQQFAFFWRGANWLFSNRENLKKFKSDPARFAPQFGSFCPVSLSNGGTDKGNPRFWKIVDDKLYFFNTEAFRDQFEKDRERILKKAAENYKPEDE